MLGRLVSTSRSIVGFTLGSAMTRRDMYRDKLELLFAMTLDGRLEPQCGGVYQLSEAGRAHEDLRARRSHGKLVLDVSGWSA